jgi:hypothetical protein
MSYLAVIGLLFTMILSTPANAGAHGSPVYNDWGDDADLSEFYSPNMIELPLDTQRDTYEVRPSIVSSNPLRTPMSVTIVERLPDYYADVVFHNELVAAYLTHETVNFIRPDGLVITVVLAPGDGDEPDVFTVLPPPGYIAIPAEMSVEEGDTGTIEIHEATLG